MQQQDEEAMRMQIELITAPKRVRRYQANNSPSIFRPLYVTVVRTYILTPANEHMTKCFAISQKWSHRANLSHLFDQVTAATD